MQGNADLHPENKTDPRILCRVWDIDFNLVLDDGSELPPPPVNRGSFVAVGDDPLGRGGGTGPNAYDDKLLEYARSAAFPTLTGDALASARAEGGKHGIKGAEFGKLGGRGKKNPLDTLRAKGVKRDRPAPESSEHLLRRLAAFRSSILQPDGGRVGVVLIGRKWGHAGSGCAAASGKIGLKYVDST